MMISLKWHHDIRKNSGVCDKYLQAIYTHGIDLMFTYLVSPFSLARSLQQLATTTAGDNLHAPHPPDQLSLCEETGVPSENFTLFMKIKVLILAEQTRTQAIVRTDLHDWVWCERRLVQRLQQRRVDEPTREKFSVSYHMKNVFERQVLGYLISNMAFNSKTHGKMPSSTYMPQHKWRNSWKNRVDTTTGHFPGQRTWIAEKYRVHRKTGKDI